MKKLTLFLVLAFCLSLIGCSKDGEITAFMSELEAVTNEMSQKLETGDVDGAQAAFDAKKESLKTKWSGMKDARGFQVSEATKKKMEEDMKKNMSTLQGAVTKGAMKIATDKSKVDKMQALMKDYAAIFTM